MGILRICDHCGKPILLGERYEYRRTRYGLLVFHSNCPKITKERCKELGIRIGPYKHVRKHRGGYSYGRKAMATA